jgi:transcriptional regulator NrdR family protein
MICPHCQCDRVSVERTRSYDNVVFRWRRCEGCGRMWTTEEVRSDEKDGMNREKSTKIDGELQ